jgi:hypothetical protein
VAKLTGACSVLPGYCLPPKITFCCSIERSGVTTAAPGVFREVLCGPEKLLWLGALREAWEEAGIPAAQVQARLGHILAHEGWSYTTVVASASEAMTPAPRDAESIEVRWVPQDKVEHLNLLPEFAANWPLLRGWLGRQLWWSRPEPAPDAVSAADLARYVESETAPWTAEVGIWYPTPARGADSAQLRADHPDDVVI